VIDALNDENGVGLEASRALHNYGGGGVSLPPSALGRLAQVAHGTADGPAYSAIGCLITHGGPGIKPLIQDILDGPESKRREHAIRALAEAGDVSILPLLRPSLREGVPAAKQIGTVRLLSALGDAKGRALYLSTIDTAQWLTTAAEVTQRGATKKEIFEASVMVSGIGKYAPEENLAPFLEEMSQYYEGKLNDSICGALGKIGSKRSIPFLIKMLPEGRRNSRGWQVDSALRQISGGDHGPDRADWQAWWDVLGADAGK